VDGFVTRDAGDMARARHILRAQKMLGLRGDAGAVEAVGKYRIVLPLGQGGTADVYLAVAEGPSGFTKLVVIKVLRKNLASDNEFRMMFLSEARLAARLHHPNVVQTNEVMEVDGAPVLVMEYLDGQPLSQVIVRGKQGGFTLAMQLRVLADALAGLHAAHELADFDGTKLGVVHRDVSLHNLFVTVEGHAKVLDFGIAKLERSLVETEVGMVKGKLRYMAPEQVAGDKLDRRADIYAAGVILWEALTGERMWRAMSEPDIRARVLAGDLPTPETARPDVPAPLARICRRALSRAPGDRHATARELADELEAAMSELGLTASQREIGATVARLFQDVRGETKRAIESKLGRASLATGVAGVSDTGETRVLRAPRPTLGPWVRVAVVAAGVATIALIASAIWRSNIVARQETTIAPAGTQAAAAAAPAPLAPAAKQRTDLTATSPDAMAKPDEGASVTAPAPKAARPAGGGAKLGPKRPPVNAASSDAAPATPSNAGAAPAAAGGAPAPAADCAHPFFVDSDGIKRFRPECM
jgi:serine/threonine protein kinase